ncbi:ferrochelatase [Ferruginibacter albus]|uniref:ferrochelatase n=1 Tax=Ferruginibacter albus TaxID=2875540 RepID=UPI001CC65562|nr:ferrochelatase [Ferruginibacter albus]UAY51621.1 ferrochelatase [Ferruginibacter albus]
MKRGIILMNLGSPDSPEVSDVKRYLREFLMDGRVIDVPFLIRNFLVKGIIIPARVKNSAEAYKSIWTKDGSPLVHLTKQLQEQVQNEFEELVEIAMRYGNPTPNDAYKKLLQKVPGLDEVILLPLYPHYAMSSYETAVEYMKEVHKKNKYSFKLTTIQPYYNNEEYINALAESIRPYIDKQYDHLLFSYHGIPERHIHKSDVTQSHCLSSDACCEIDSPAHEFCYRHQVRQTTKLVTEKLNLPANKYSISFQSRLNQKWLKPFTDVRFQEMPKEGVKKLLVVCPAFVSDCLETLEEIAERGKKEFLHAGGESYEMIPCLNVHPLWVKAIVKLIESQELEVGSQASELSSTN